MRFFMTALVFFILIFSSFAQLVFPEQDDFSYNILPTYEAREELYDKIMAPLFEFYSLDESEYFQRTSSVTVKVRAIRNNEGAYMLFIPQYKGSYPVDAPGTWIIKRSPKDGSFVQAKIFIGSSPENAIRIYPDKNISRMDVSIMGITLKKAVFIRHSFSELLTLPLSRILSETDEQVNWKMLLPPQEGYAYQASSSMAESILQNIKRFPDADDGALDENGRFVFIASQKPMPKPGFNCSGFAKWIGDSISYALTGRLLDIAELKQRLTELRGSRLGRTYETLRDPYFGLDWTRNLAYRLNSLLGEENPATKEGWDVRELYGLRYVEDKGYRAEELYTALYLAAIKYPGYFFAASVNGYWGSDPVLWQHFHVAVFLPYFDESGIFKVTVVERNRATALSSFIKRYPAHYIHLVRIKTPEHFEPYIPWE